MQITHRDTFSAVNELTGAAMTIKGNHYEKGQRIPDGERKLYLIIEGPTELVVKRAKVSFCPCTGHCLQHLSCMTCLSQQVRANPGLKSSRVLGWQILATAFKSA